MTKTSSGRTCSLRQSPPTKNPSATPVHFGLNLPRPSFGIGIGFGVKGSTLVWVTRWTDLAPSVATVLPDFGHSCCRRFLVLVTSGLSFDSACSPPNGEVRGNDEVRGIPQKEKGPRHLPEGLLSDFSPVWWWYSYQTVATKPHHKAIKNSQDEKLPPKLPPEARRCVGYLRGKAATHGRLPRLF
jgi:hypothetical protein